MFRRVFVGIRELRRSAGCRSRTGTPGSGPVAKPTARGSVGSLSRFANCAARLGTGRWLASPGSRPAANAHGAVFHRVFVEIRELRHSASGTGPRPASRPAANAAGRPPGQVPGGRLSMRPCPRFAIYAYRCPTITPRLISRAPAIPAFHGVSALLRRRLPARRPPRPRREPPPSARSNRQVVTPQQVLHGAFPGGATTVSGKPRGAGARAAIGCISDPEPDVS